MFHVIKNEELKLSDIPAITYTHGYLSSEFCNFSFFGHPPGNEAQKRASSINKKIENNQPVTLTELRIILQVSASLLLDRPGREQFWEPKINHILELMKEKIQNKDFE